MGSNYDIFAKFAPTPAAVWLDHQLIDSLNVRDEHIRDMVA